MSIEYRPGRMNDRIPPDVLAARHGYAVGRRDGLSKATSLVRIAAALLRPRLTDDGVAALDELLRLLAAERDAAGRLAEEANLAQLDRPS